MSRAVSSTPGNVLHVYVYVNGASEPIVVDNVQVTDDGRSLKEFKFSLLPGTYSLRLEYLVTVAECQAEPIRLARTTELENVVISASNSIIDFSSVSIERPLFDDDEDGTDNLTELENSTFPCKRVATLAAPQNLRLKPGDGRITIQWDPVEGAQSYNVYYGTADGLSVQNYKNQGGTRMPQETSSATANGLRNGSAYTVLVTAVSGTEESPPVSGRITPKVAIETAYFVNVRVNGLVGKLVLSNVDENLTVTTSGRYGFLKALKNGASYSVSIVQQPSNQTCIMTGKTSGTINDAHVFGVEIECDVPLYRIQVLVRGLKEGSELVLQNNAADDLAISAAGQATFSKRLQSGKSYSVTVKNQPSTTESCIVVGSSGAVGTADVTTITVECAETAVGFTVGGEVRGLKGRVVIQSGAEELAIFSSGNFRFSSMFTDKQSYDVKVKQSPESQICSLTNATGSISAANVDNIAVECVDQLALNVNPLSQEFELTWNSDDLATYELYVSTASACDIGTYTGCPGGEMVSNLSSPHLLTSRLNGQLYYLQLKADYGSGLTMTSPEVRVRPGNLVPDGVVNDIEVAPNGSVYLGGRFTRMHVPLGGGGVVDISTGKRLSAFQIEGNVRAAVSDNQGGWYVGGQFSYVNGVARENLVHILADDSVDTTFDVPVTGTNAYVGALWYDSERLYVGGDFSQLGTENRQYLASIDVASRQPTTWNPSPRSVVRAITGGSSRVYVLGQFDSQNSGPPPLVAAYDFSGNRQSWEPIITAASSELSVEAITVGAGRVYIVGQFSAVNGTERINAVAFSEDGTLDEGWNSAGSFVRIGDAVATANGLYIGAFSRTDGTVLSKLDLQTGQSVLSSSLLPTWPNKVVLSLSENTILVGLGDRLSSFSESTTFVPGWSTPGAAPGLNNVTISGGQAFVGLQGNTNFLAQGYPRKALAALDPHGRLIRWGAEFATNPNESVAVKRLINGENIIYILGYFSSVNGEPRNGLAAIDQEGNLSDWNPASLGTVPVNDITSMIHLNDVVYFGGSFANFAGQIRGNAAAIELSGGVTNWNPAPNGAVNALATNGVDTIYLGGDFSEVSAIQRQGSAAVGVEGQVRADWGADVATSVTALVRGGDTLYMGGVFESFGSVGTHHLSEVTLAGVSKNSGWSRSISVLSLAYNNDSLWISFVDNEVGELARPVLFAVLNKSPTQGLSLTPLLDGVVSEVAAEETGGKVYIAGDFTNVDRRLRPRFAVFDALLID